MKKLVRLLLLVLVFIPCVFLLSACGSKAVVDIYRSENSTQNVSVYIIKYSDGSTGSFSVENGKDGADLNINDIYQEAKQNGFSGTFLEFLELYLDVEIPTDHSANINKALMSVVTVAAEFHYETSDFLNTYKDTAVGYGAGVVYDLDKENGTAYIITNYHVLYNDTTNCIAQEIRCATYGTVPDFEWVTNKDGTSVTDAEGYPEVEYYGNYFECEYVGGSMLYDIAIIKVQNSDYVKNGGLIEANFANSNDVVVGSDVYAVGNPKNGGISATRGIVSVASEYAITTLANGTYAKTRVIRIDAAINGGNSGGGLFNANGEIIGIVNSKLVDEGIENIGYAIPSNIATAVANNIISSGQTSPFKAYVGISLESTNARAVYDEELERAVVKEDVLIASVAEDGLAKAAGLKVGDQIESITHTGKTIEIYMLHDVVDLSWNFKIGEVVTFKIKGKADPISIVITADCFDWVE